ncbi:hypothetical protein [Paraglaciecola sp. 25GB23A]|uniref:hypothetical protein n=1 Tax=Paraglaciecola sp. 25GB23A TaxID=3156068 RepID=UPI0032AF1E92
MKKLLLISLTSLFFSNAFAEDEDKYNPSQSAILFKTSNICHAENLGNSYKNMLAKASVGGAIYELKNSLTECITDGGQLDKRYSKHFPELELMATQIAKSKQKAKLEAELNKATPDPTVVKDTQEAIEITQKLENKNEEKVKEVQETAEKAKEDANKFYGFNWAPGIAVMSYDSAYIDDVRIDSTGEGDAKINKVYIDREVKMNLAVLLETHYLWPWKVDSIARDTGIGFFAATNLVKQEGAPLSVFAFGPMFSVRDKDSANGFSVGIAYFVDTDFKVLRDDLSDGDITTYEDTAKIIRKVDESGWLLMISSKF